jgi:Uncharacterised protein family UPF0564.
MPFRKVTTLIHREEEEKRLNLLRYQLCRSPDEIKPESNVIKANPVPIESQVPLYDKIMAEQENRQVNTNSY